MRSKMRGHVPSSIYWDSVDSSGGSSGGGSGGTGSGSRNYVDPWDLENYAYLRRHSIAAAANSPQPIYQSSRSVYGSRLSHHSVQEPDYWYAPAIREPGYDAPGSVEEIYFRPPPRPLSTGCYYHPQPIYEDEAMSHYAAPIPLYAHLSELEHAEALEELRTREIMRRRSKAARARSYPREECFYHGRPLELPLHALSLNQYPEESSVDDEVDEVPRYHREPNSKTSHMGLSAYGHLKIDYTNSWNSLHRKIASK